MAFPLVVFAIWRVGHGLVVALAGGDPIAATFAFDGSFYRSIQQDGYVRPEGGYSEFSNVAFFPGVVWLSEAVQLIVGEPRAAALVVANAVAAAAFVTVWGACRAWVDSATARRAVIAFALTPTSYFVWSFYSDGLLIAATAAAAWAGRRGRHGWAMAALVAASTARLVGVGVGPVLALVRVVRLRRVDRVALGYIAASAVGLAAVMARQWFELGDPFGWAEAQEAWGRTLAPPWQPVIGAIRTLGDPGPQEGVVLDLVCVAAVLVGVAALTSLARRGRVPAEAPAIAAVTWLAPLFSTLLSSTIRFALGAWPVLLVPAMWWPRWPRWLRVLTVVSSAVLTVILLDRLADGMFTA